MTKVCMAIVSVGVLGVASIGCGEVPPDAETETSTSALVGAPILGVHGFTRNDGIHAVVYKSLETGTVAQVEDPVGGSFQHFDLSTAQVLNTPSGLKRTDNVNAIPFIATNGHLHEVSQSGTGGVWTDFDFATSFGINAPVAATTGFNDSLAYIRTDSKNIYIYRGANNHVIEVASNFGGSPPWVASDLTAFTGGPNVRGAIFPYVRTDNVNALVYTGSDGHIHEISSTPGTVTNWFDNDLFAAAGLGLSIANDPWGFKRVDNSNSVVFNDGVGGLRELILTPGTFCSGFPWCNDLLATDVSRSFDRPSGYIRWDNHDAIVYISASNTINEMARTATGPWFESNLTAASGSGGDATLSGAVQLFGARKPGSLDSVLFEANSTASGTDPLELFLGLSGGWGFRQFDFF